jgi:TolA-binding protein
MNRSFQFVFSFIASCLTMMTSCATSSSEGEGMEGKIAGPAEAVDVANTEWEKLSPEMKQARIWQRLDTMEAEVRNQRAKIKLLQKGLMLGIVPDELKNPDDVAFEKAKRDAAKKKAAHPEKKNDDKHAKDDNHDKPAEKVAAKPAVDKGTFQSRFAEAQDLVRVGRYGKAVVELEKLSQDFPEESGKDGSPAYWIAVSWYNLKEFNTAKDQFRRFIDANGQSAWTPRAKIYAAKIEYQLGLKEKSIDSLKKIISDDPSGETADVARQELEAIKQAM